MFCNMRNLHLVCFLLLSCAFTLTWSLQLPDVYSYYNPSKTYENMTVCEMALEKFAQSSSNYTLCTIRNSQPIRACELCVDSYMNVKAAHQNILTSEINGTKCKDKLINLDRLEIIESTFRGIKDIWYRGFCEKCFEWSDGTPSLSNVTKKFKIYFETAHTCINNHIEENMLQDNKTDKICKDCMDDYLQLNSFYDSLKTSETKGICMDIVDSMNATRSFWSGVLNCCKLRRTPEMIFLFCTGLITVLPVLFYLSAKIFFETAPRIEVRQHDLIEPVNCMATTSSRDR